MYMLRRVAESDAEILLKIYETYIETPITFECELPSVEDFQKRIQAFSADYPYIVCEIDGEIVGYAYAHRFRERAAYDWNVELSIYISSLAQGKGIGKAMYHALIESLYNYTRRFKMKIAFLDRDGTISENYDDNELKYMKKLIIKDGTIDGLKHILSKGYKIIIVTNQYLISEKFITQSQYDKFTETTFGFNSQSKLSYYTNLHKFNKLIYLASKLPFLSGEIVQIPLTPELFKNQFPVVIPVYPVLKK